jgi:dolichyl-phosphate-mannose-protein mannosyltransferase
MSLVAAPDLAAAQSRVLRGIALLRSDRSGRSDERVLGWLGPLVVFGLALALRLYHLGSPKTQMFDEAYYPNDAASYLRAGVEGHFSVPNPTGKGDPYRSLEYATHPPLGKWMIAVGEQIFGFTPVGWRIASAICGALTVLILCRLVRRMTGSTALGMLAGILLSLDGLHLTLSRIGILDVLLSFWLVAALACLVADRDDGRRRIADRLAHGTRWAGPRLGVRWWRIGAGACLGCAGAVKWSAAPFIVTFALLALLWDSSSRRASGATHPVRATLWRDGPQAAATFVLLPLVIYVSSWSGWFAGGAGFGHGRDWHADVNGRNPVATARAWWHYHSDTLEFHTTLTNPGTHHEYESKPFGWLVLSRPVLFAYDTVKAGDSLDGQTCNTPTKSDGSREDCSRAVTGIGTPALWYAGLLAFLGCVGLWAGRRDWRAGAVVALFAAGFLPWLQNPQRVMFLFYAQPLVIAYCIALPLCAGYLIGGPAASERRRLVGTSVVSVVLALIVADFIWLRPVLMGDVIPYSAWSARVLGRLGSPGWL